MPLPQNAGTVETLAWLNKNGNEETKRKLEEFAEQLRKAEEKVANEQAIKDKVNQLISDLSGLLEEARLHAHENPEFWKDFDNLTIDLGDQSYAERLFNAFKFVINHPYEYGRLDTNDDDIPF